MLTYSLKKNNGISMYENLYRYIKNDIVNNKLIAHEKLPSKRALAKNLGISVITVEHAYLQLIDEGYIYSKPKSGYFVAPMLQIAKTINTNAKLNIQEPRKTNFFTEFSSSSIPPETFPYNIWTRLLRNTITTIDEHSLLSDTSAGGVYPLRCAIANYLYQFRGLSVLPQQIIIGAGTQTLYNLIDII